MVTRKAYYTSPSLNLFLLYWILIKSTFSDTLCFGEVHTSQWRKTDTQKLRNSGIPTNAQKNGEEPLEKGSSQEDNEEIWGGVPSHQ